MNDTAYDTAYDPGHDTRPLDLHGEPDVEAFVQRVRAALADLPRETVDDLVEGLAADLAEQVAETGRPLSELVGDPEAYAAELRAAAGLGAASGSRRRRGAGGGVNARLDRLRTRGEELVARPGLAGAWSFVVALRPAWWVLRAWVAVALGLSLLGRGDAIAVVPEPGDSLLLGLLLLTVAVVGSVQLGRGRWWPGRRVDRTRAASRLLLVGLNALALVALVPVLDHQVTPSQAQRWYGGGYHPGTQPGLLSNGRIVANVFPYDADGEPLTGVQLFDQAGRPLAVDVEWAGSYRFDGRWVDPYPWYNGAQRLYNVFPLPVRVQRGYGRPLEAWSTANPPELPSPPLRVVPPASLPTQAGAEGRDTGSDRERERSGSEKPRTGQRQSGADGR